MELEIYQAETARIAAKQAANLEDARQILASGRPLSRLEEALNNVGEAVRARRNDQWE